MTDTIRAQLQESLGDGYQITAELSGGGMSRVFVADELRLRRKVVVKTLSPELAQGINVERFEREIQTVASLQQANIVPVLTAGDSNGLPYYIMPFVDGLSLRTRLVDGAALPTTEAISILRDVARALAYAHDRGVVHRDIKPDNILLSGGTAVVTDFGIAKAVNAARKNAGDGTLTQLGTAIGTPAYMAPEQAAGDPDTDHRADLYAFGCVAFELLTGAAPFSGSAHELVRAHIADTPVSLQSHVNIPPRLATLVMQCLAKDPAERPESARMLLDALGMVESVPHVAIAPTRGRQMLIGLLLLVVVAVVSAGVWYSRSRDGALPPAATTMAADSLRSVAVMPLTNATGDTAVEYFADGMTDEVTNALARVPGLRVASRASTMAFKVRGTLSSAGIAKTLGVRTLLEGSVRRQGRRIRVTAQLTNASDGSILWSDRFDADASDVFAVQDSIARSIASRLQITLDGTRRLATAGTANVEAHDRYLRARYLASPGTRPALEQSLVLFREAIALDARYAQAWAGIATAYMNLADSYLPPRDAYPKAKEALLAASAIDSMSPEVHAALASLAFNYYWDLPLAKRESEIAIRLDPNSLDALRFYTVILIEDQKPDSALAIAKRAMRLDPTDAVATVYGACALVSLGRDAAADSLMSRALQTSPDNQFVNFVRGLLLLRQERYAESRTHFVKAADLGRPLVAIVDAHAGRREEALFVAKQLEAERATRYVTADLIGAIYAELGNTDLALKWAAIAIEERSANMAARMSLTSITFAWWRTFADNPRFQALLRTRKTLQ